MKTFSSILRESSKAGSWEHGAPVPLCGNTLIHHHCGQAARPLLLIFNVARTDNTESFYHPTEVLTSMFLQRLRVIFGQIQALVSSPSNWLELECRAVEWALDTLKYCLPERDFSLETDHRALQWLGHMKDFNARVTRWFLAL